MDATGLYCKAFRVRDLTSYPGWTKGNRNGALLEPHEIVFLHDDFTVTRGSTHGAEVVFDQVTPEWIAFCCDVLAFVVPPELLRHAKASS